MFLLLPSEIWQIVLDKSDFLSQIIFYSNNIYKAAQRPTPKNLYPNAHNINKII